ncbi:hypothetical protein [Haloarchaeobius sp. DFWS5]
MSDFETYACAECGADFVARSGANAAENEYCSPACETAGKGL